MTTLRRPRPGEWSRLASLSASRFATTQRPRAAVPVAILRRPLLWLAAWLDLVGGMAWTTEGADALTMLGGPGKRQHARQLGVAVVATVASAAALVAVGSLAPSAATVVLGAAIFAILGWYAVASLRTVQAVGRLRRLRPGSAHFVYGLAASAEAPGSGRRLLAALCHAADEHGWVLCLEAREDMLAYYAGFDFARVGPGSPMPWGETVTVMVRYPHDRGPTG
jgi:hypothetical protein